MQKYDDYELEEKKSGLLRRFFAYAQAPFTTFLVVMFFALLADYVWKVNTNYLGYALTTYIGFSMGAAASYLFAVTCPLIFSPEASRVC